MQDPSVPHRVHERPDEENREDDMRKGQPIGAVSQPRMRSVALAETIADRENPTVESIGSIGGVDWGRHRQGFSPSVVGHLLQMPIRIARVRPVCCGATTRRAISFGTPLQYSLKLKSPLNSKAEVFVLQNQRGFSARAEEGRRQADQEQIRGRVHIQFKVIEADHKFKATT